MFNTVMLIGLCIVAVTTLLNSVLVYMLAKDIRGLHNEVVFIGRKSGVYFEVPPDDNKQVFVHDPPTKQRTGGRQGCLT